MNMAESESTSPQAWHSNRWTLSGSKQAARSKVVCKQLKEMR